MNTHLFTKSNTVTMSLCMLLLVAAIALATPGSSITIKVENLADAGGLFFTPVWVGLHNGSFDVFDAGSAASGELEMLAEAGNTSGLNAIFTGFGVQDVIAPGTPYGPAGSAFASSAQKTLMVNPLRSTKKNNRFPR